MVTANICIDTVNAHPTKWVVSKGSLALYIPKDLWERVSKNGRNCVVSLMTVDDKSCLIVVMDDTERKYKNILRKPKEAA
jgi:hypothetical protein